MGVITVHRPSPFGGVGKVAEVITWCAEATIELRLDRRSRDVMMALARAAIDWDRTHGESPGGTPWGRPPGSPVNPDAVEARIQNYWGGVHLSLGGPSGGMPPAYVRRVIR